MKPELEIFLKNIPIHDSEFKIIQYDIQCKKVIVYLFNPIEKQKLKIEFINVLGFVSTHSNEWGVNQSVLSFSLEDDCNFFKPFTTADNQICFHFMFQLFSKSELHILCHQINIDTLFDI